MLIQFLFNALFATLHICTYVYVILRIYVELPSSLCWISSSVRFGATADIVQFTTSFTQRVIDALKYSPSAHLCTIGVPCTH